MESRKLGILVSAYLEGDLSDADRALLEKKLSSRPSIARALEEMSVVREWLSELPSEAAPVDLFSKVRRRIMVGPPSDSTDSTPVVEMKRPVDPAIEMLIEAYVDHELPPQKRRMVREKLKASPTFQACLDQLEETLAHLGTLKEASLPADFQTKLREALEAEARTLAESTSDELEFLTSPSKPAASVPLAAMLEEAQKGAGAPSEEHRRNYDRPDSRWNHRAVHQRGRLMRWAFGSAVLIAGVAAVMVLPKIANHHPSSNQERQVALHTQPNVPAEPTAEPSRDVAASSLHQPSTGAVTEVAISNSSAAHGATDLSVSSPIATAPKTDELLADSLKTADLPSERLARLQVGDIVKLRGSQIRLVCLDVDKMYDRLRIVLADHDVRVSDVGLSQGRDSSSASAQNPSGLYVVEVTTTPTRIADILADLHFGEQDKRLVEDVAVSTPPAGLLASIQKVMAKSSLSSPAVPEGEQGGKGVAIRLDDDTPSSTKPAPASRSLASSQANRSSSSSKASVKIHPRSPSDAKGSSIRVAKKAQPPAPNPPAGSSKTIGRIASIKLVDPVPPAPAPTPNPTASIDDRILVYFVLASKTAR